MRRLLAVISVFGAVWCAAALPAQAACTGIGTCSCTVDTPDITFGDYNPVSLFHVDTVTSVDVECTASLVGLFISYEVDLSAGGSGDQLARELAQGGSSLSYNLYLDLLRTNIWGDGSGGTGTLAGAQLISILIPWTTSFPIYGRLPAGQDVASGGYADTLIATVVY